MQEKCTTQSCLRFVLIFAQCFGLLPVTGITYGSSFVKFKWTAKRTIYSLLFALISTVNALVFAAKMMKENELTFADWCTFQFYVVSVVTIILFIQVGQEWEILMKNWTEVDIAMNNGFPCSLHKKLKIVMFAILAAAVVEHTLYIATEYQSQENYNKTIDSYFRQRFKYMFGFVSYRVELGIFLQILNLFNTLSWNFMDVFIIMISMCLSVRFSQIASNVENLVTKQINNESSWRKSREDYTRLVNLSKVLDNVTSGIVTLSFGNNIFVILVQLYKTIELSQYKSIEGKIYSVYSFIFLIIRMIAVALYAADINNESKKPRHYLSKLPLSMHNVEIERLLHQAKSSPAALSGYKMFRVTKTLILRICVALVSYELVLAQYLSVKDKKV